VTQPLVLFGGTFDPPHRRHVELAESARDLLHADEVLFVPVNVNPQRAEHPPAPANDRMALVECAIAGRPALRASDLELRRTGPSYTVDTLRVLRADGERRPIRLLIGSDQARNFHSWREPDAILEMATPAIVLRPPDTREQFVNDAEQSGDVRMLAWLLPVDPVECSSTDARRRLAAGEPVDDLLDPAVVRLIRERSLYGGDSHRSGGL